MAYSFNEKTGIIEDYWNEYFRLDVLFQTGGLYGVVQGLQQRPVAGYRQRFQDVAGLVTDDNRTTIVALNDLARKVNEVYFNPQTFTEDTFRKSMNEACILITGTKHFVYGKDQRTI